MNDGQKNTQAAPKSVEVVLLGQRLRLKSGDDTKRIENLADYVGRKIDELQASGVAASGVTRIALLAAINIASDYFRTLDEARDFRRDVRQRTESIVADIEAAMDNSPNVSDGQPTSTVVGE